jgi:sec-independent protein translocase protein TatB
MMIGIGPWELVVIVIVALIFIRPSDLPAVLRKIGKFFAELRSLRDEVTRSLSEVEREIESSVSVERGSSKASAALDALQKQGGDGHGTFSGDPARAEAAGGPPAGLGPGEDAKEGPPTTTGLGPGEDARS